MNPEKLNPIVVMILSLVPFAVVGGWLVYREMKARGAFSKRAASTTTIIRVGDTKYRVKKAVRLVVVEKETGREAIVTTCGSEKEPMPVESALNSLPEWVKVRYRLGNGVFSPEESDWLEGDGFRLVEVARVDEYEPVRT